MEKSVGKSRVYGTVHPPCSKSYAQRAMAAALLAEGESTLGNIELCDDTRYALKVIEDLGAAVRMSDPHTISIKGGLDPRSDIINTGESGLAARLFTPVAALCDRRITINGEGSMLRRPIGMMIRPLRQLGVNVESNGYLPISVEGPILGGDAEVEGYVSSQFITGLLTALPLAKADTTLRLTDTPNSIPYLAMTIDMASKFGIRIDHRDYEEYFVKSGQKYIPSDIDIEGDWGCAAFMLVAGAIAGEVTAADMNQVSLQADMAVIDALIHAGACITTTSKDITAARHELHAFEFDATHRPDLFPILVVLAANCEGVSVIKGVSRLVHKESNRADAILGEYTRIGIDVSLHDEDRMVIKGGPVTGGRISSRGDHRIAMAAAVAGLTASSPVIIDGAEAVNKSYPRFWDDLEKIIG